MAVLHVLEGMRNPFLNKFLSMITYLGDEMAFIAVGLILYWCWNKKAGRYVIITALYGNVINQFIKLACRVPRPWVRDETLTIVESARAREEGYSFPSGHSSNATAVFGGIARWTKSRALRVLGICLAALVCFSRLYLGVHTPADVLAGAGGGLLLLLALYPLLAGEKATPQKTRMVLIVGVLLSLANALYVSLAHFPADVDAANMAAASKNAWTLLGGSLGMWLGAELDERKIHFVTDALWWAQALKLALGFALVLGIRAGLKAPLNALFGGHPAANGARYFLVVFFASGVWPLTFKAFAKLGRK